MPVIVVLKLNVVMLLSIVGETVNVTVALIAWLGANTVFCLFQFTVIPCEAVDGDQPFVAMVRVKFDVPVFFIQTAKLAESPGFKSPQLIDDRACVQPLSEYRPRFAFRAMILPLEPRLLLAIRAP